MKLYLRDVVLGALAGVPEDDLVATKLDNGVLFDNAEIFAVIAETSLTIFEKGSKYVQTLLLGTYIVDICNFRMIPI